MNKECPVQKICGGCTRLHESYEEQLKHKHEELSRLYPKYHVELTIGMKNPYHYRHKVYAAFGTDRNGRLVAGMYAEHTHRIVSSGSCLIQNETANRILEGIIEIAEEMHLPAYEEDTERGVLRHAYIRVAHATGKAMAVIVIGSEELPGAKKFVSLLTQRFPEIETVVLNYNRKHTSMVLGERSRVLYGPGYLTDELLGMKFHLSPASFYQVNPVQTEVLYQTAIDLAGITDHDAVLDACCGIGTISLIAARQAKEVVGVEISPDAIRDAQHNAKLNHITNADFYCDDANSFLDRLIDRPDVVLLDPPRAGMKQEFMQHLAEMKPDRVVYISCFPETQARDIKNLTCRGYRVKKIVPVDLFPMTDHVETIVLLSRTNS